MHNIFKKTPPTNLTKKQKEVFELIANKGYSLFCNEGVSYSCWLEHEDNNKPNITINRRTANALDKNGIITIDNNYNHPFKFRMKIK